MEENNQKIVMATSTAALPAWMFKKYPEVRRTGGEVELKEYDVLILK